MSSVNATSCSFAPVGRGRSKKFGLICADSNVRTVSTFSTCGVTCGVTCTLGQTKHAGEFFNDFPFSILLLESTCGVTSGLGLANVQPAAVNKILPKLRPAIPAQKPNQPRLWLACACQRWSRKPNHRREAPDTIFRTTLTGAGEPYNGRGERAGILPVRMQNEHRVTNIIAARGNKFVAPPPVNESIEPIVSPLILSPPIRPKKIYAEAEKQFADAPENLSPPRLKRHSGIQCFLCLNQAKPFVNQFFPNFIQRLF
jgi:hypothetical protein